MLDESTVGAANAQLEAASLYQDMLNAIAALESRIAALEAKLED
jgi:hypothetical protein